MLKTQFIALILFIAKNNLIVQVKTQYLLIEVYNVIS